MRLALEKHTYAPELNRVHFIDKGVSLPVAGLVSISQVRENLFRPVRIGRYVTISVTNKDHPSINREYKGYIDEWGDLKYTLKNLEKRHNLPNTKFKIKTRFIG